MKKDTYWIVGLCFAFLCLAGIFFYRGQKNTVVSGELLAAEGQGKDIPLQENTEDVAAQEPDVVPVAESAVAVLGAVKHPGIFRYEGTARVYDAIEALGGFTKKAARDSVNLAKFLVDGEQILVLTKKQVRKQRGNGFGEEKSSGSDLASADDVGRVNINIAGKEELMKLPGIGEAKAELILHYREEHGAFSQPEDLMQISGIKEGIYQKLKDFITT